MRYTPSVFVGNGIELPVLGAATSWTNAFSGSSPCSPPRPRHDIRALKRIISDGHGEELLGGNKELGKAKEYQRSSRKCLCIGIIILLLLVLLVIVPIATSLRRS